MKIPKHHYCKKNSLPLSNTTFLLNFYSKNVSQTLIISNFFLFTQSHWQQQKIKKSYDEQHITKATLHNKKNIFFISLMTITSSKNMFWQVYVSWQNTKHTYTHTIYNCLFPVVYTHYYKTKREIRVSLKKERKEMADPMIW